MNYAILDGHNVKPVSDVLQWSQWFESARGQRHVGDDTIDRVQVSTVFLGINHKFSNGPDEWFETMVFDANSEDQHCERYATWEEAAAGHKAAVELVKSSLAVN